MQIPFSVMAQQLSLDVLQKRKCSNNIDEIIKEASHFKKVIMQTSEASQCYMTALDTWFDRYPKRTVKHSKRCHLESIQLSSCCCFYHKGSKEHRKPKRHGRQTQIVMNQTKRGQIRPGRKCTTVNWMQADPSLEQHTFSETNDLQEHWDSWLEVGRHACAWRWHVKCQGVNE